MFWHHISVLRYQLLLLLATALIAISILLITYNDAFMNLVPASLILGEVFLPAIAGWLAAGLLLRDSLLEILATTPYALWRIAIERLTVILLFGTLLWLVVLIVAWQLTIPPFRSPVNWSQMLVANLVAMLLFAAVGFWGSLILRSWAGGSLLVLLLWGSGLFLAPIWLNNPLFFPFLTLFQLDNSIWLYNRLVLLLIALALLLWGCLSIRREQLLQAVGESEL